MVHSADKAQGIRRVILAKANGAIAQGVLVPPTPAGLAGLPGTKTPPIP